MIGRKEGIRLQTHTDWSEMPNVWGMLVGRPGLTRSPAMKTALLGSRIVGHCSREVSARTR